MTRAESIIDPNACSEEDRKDAMVAGAVLLLGEGGGRSCRMRIPGDIPGSWERVGTKERKGINGEAVVCFVSFNDMLHLSFYYRTQGNVCVVGVPRKSHIQAILPGTNLFSFSMVAV